MKFYSEDEHIYLDEVLKYFSVILDLYVTHLPKQIWKWLNHYLKDQSEKSFCVWF